MASFQRPSISFYVGLATIALGFVCIRIPPFDGALSLTAAPLLLLLGFMVLIPVGLWPRAEQSPLRHYQSFGAKKSAATALVGIGVFIGSLSVYIATAWPGPGWWDSGSYVAGSYTLGVTAPPGSMLLQLLGRLFSSLVFIGSPAVRLNTMISIIVASAVTTVYFSVVRLLRSFDDADYQSRRIVIIAGVAASLALAFTQSVWSKATFTNPYALSLLTGCLMIYLAVRWWEDPDRKGSCNLLLLAAFLFGMDINVHRSNILLAPAFFVLVLIRRPKVFLDLRLWAGSTALLALGISMQLTVMLRAQLNPQINLGNPDTLRGLWDYLTLSQFGIATFGSDLLQRKGPFWDYQVKEMYLRYFGWNFLGIDCQGGGVRWLGLFGIPLLVGLLGLIYHFVRRTWQAVPFAVAFLLASLGAIFYLNVPADFFREMDRHFLVSFMLFDIWIGIGCYAILRYVPRAFARTRTPSSTLTWILSGLLTLALPVNMLVANWKNNDMSDNYASYDYGYNTLQTCEPGAILITRGDSDTFLAWYMQLGEGIRTDVTVLNINLLNTEWYVRTILTYHPNLPWSIDEDTLGSLRHIHWSTDTVTISGSGMPDVSLIVEPSYGGKILLIQDQLLLDIIKQNMWGRPIYFSAGFGSQLPLGLSDYCRNDGLAWRVVPQAGELDDYSALESNLLNRFSFRNHGNRAFFDETGLEMTRTYIHAFIRLAAAYVQHDEQKKLDRLKSKFDEFFPDLGDLENLMDIVE
jgi:hypothetical protein